MMAIHKLEASRRRRAICHLRTAVGASGKRLFVAFADMQQRAHLFDENWKLLVIIRQTPWKTP